MRYCSLPTIARDNSPRVQKSPPTRKSQFCFPEQERRRRHHFCVERSAVNSFPSQTAPEDEEQSVTSIDHDSGRQVLCQTESHRPPSSSSPAADSSADNKYRTYNMSAINKLLSELAEKQQECRKIQQQATVHNPLRPGLHSLTSMAYKLCLFL